MATLTIQTTSTLTADTYLNHNNDHDNYGTEAHLNVGDNSGDQKRSILKFDFSALPIGAVISAVELDLYYYDAANADPVGRTYWAYRLTQRNWTETGASYNHYTGSSSWVTEGGDYTTTDGASHAVPAAAGWIDWDVLTQVQFAQASTGKVAHFLIRDGSETNIAIAKFYSSEYVTDTTKCPKLIITYTVVGWNHLKNGLAVTSNSKVNGVDTATGMTSVDGVV